jgi:cysteine desulfurase/selenocysteine lyase
MSTHDPLAALDPLDALASAAATAFRSISSDPLLALVTNIANELFRGAALPTPDAGSLSHQLPTGFQNPSVSSAKALFELPTLPNSLQDIESGLARAVSPSNLDALVDLATKGTQASVPGLANPFAIPTVIPPLTSPRENGVFDVAQIRAQFPILREVVDGHPLVWLDNAATTQKPQVVIDRLSHFYAHENSNIHRAAHTLAARSTDAYEGARASVARFLGASSPSEIVFVRGATEGINLIAQGWGRRHLHPGDEIILSGLEHHSNIVPWQHIAAERGARIRVIPLDGQGQIRLDAFERLLSSRTRIIGLSQVSNALGTVLPIKELVALAHQFGARVVVDGAQAVSHMPIDVQSLDCDYYVFSGHKVFGPTGIGAVYGKSAALEEIGPWQGGGNMIADVTFDRTTYADIPFRLEAGTGNIADAVGLGTALDWLSSIGLDRVHQHEDALLRYGTKLLQDIPGLRLIGTAPDKAGVLSFVIDGLKVEEIGKALAASGIAVRAGHHCAQPALRHFGLEATVRPSLALYNTYADLDALGDVLRDIVHRKGRRA